MGTPDTVDAAQWIKTNFFPNRQWTDEHPLHMGIRGKTGLFQRQDVLDIGRSVVDEGWGYLALYTPINPETEIQIPDDHTQLIEGLRRYSAEITALASYSLYSSESFTKVPSLNSRPIFSNSEVQSRIRIGAARFVDSLVLALTIGNWGDRISRVGLHGVLMKLPSGDSQVIFAPVENDGNGAKSRTNHGKVYKIQGTPRMSRIYDNGDPDIKEILRIVRQDQLSNLLLAIASNYYLV